VVDCPPDDGVVLVVVVVQLDRDELKDLAPK